jgi:hypothetical protein
MDCLFRRGIRTLEYDMHVVFIDPAFDLERPLVVNLQTEVRTAVICGSILTKGHICHYKAVALSFEHLHVGEENGIVECAHSLADTAADAVLHSSVNKYMGFLISCFFVSRSDYLVE